MKPPIFICGTPRSGTTIFFKMMTEHSELSWLSTFADKYPDKIYLNKLFLKCLSVPGFNRKLRESIQPSEAYNFWQTLFPGFRRPCRDLRAFDATPKVKSRIHKALASAASCGQRDRLIIKITGWPRIGFLQEIFPSATFIHVRRDGRAVANSLLGMNFWNGWQGPQNWRMGLLPDELQALWARYNYSFVALAGIEWIILENAFQQAKNTATPDSVMTIQYEDFCKAPLNTLQSVFQFCELDWGAGLHKRLSSYSVRNVNNKWQQDLSAAQQDELNSILAPYLKNFGYNLSLKPG